MDLVGALDAARGEDGCAGRNLQQDLCCIIRKIKYTRTSENFGQIVIAFYIIQQHESLHLHPSHPHTPNILQFIKYT